MFNPLSIMVLEPNIFHFQLRTHLYLVKLNEPFPRQLAVIEAIK